MVIALTALYTGDMAEQVRIYNQYNMNTRDFFAACVNGNFMPRPNKVQKLINQLCPKSTHLNLYIGLERDDKPTHYMSLVRHVESGLWHLKSTRLSSVRLSSRPPRDGIRAYWKTGYIPLPEIACALPVHFSRILGGGSRIHEMVMEIEESPELQRQLTHCAMISELFGNLRSDSITVRSLPGKVVFRIGYTDSIDSGFVIPYTFKPVYVNPYARRVEKPNVVIWGNASVDSLLTKQVPRSIQPEIRNATEHIFESSNKEEEFVSEVLLSRLLPFVGIGRDNETIDIFGLSYNPDRQKTIITAYSLARREASFAMIPTFYADSSGSGRQHPNDRAVEVLKCMLSELSTATKERQYWIFRLFEWLGLRKLETFIKAFQFWRQPLSDEETAAIAECLR